MRTLTRYYENTTVTAAFATLRVDIDGILELPVVKAVIENGFHASLLELLREGGTKLGATATLLILGQKGEEPIVKLKGYDVANERPCAFHIRLSKDTSQPTVELVQITDLPQPKTVQALIVIEDLRYRAVQASANATLVEEEELPSAEDKNVPTWIPSVDMLVRIKEGFRGCKEVYILKDIDVYEQAFILTNADSARRQRDVQRNVQHIGLNRTRVYDHELEQSLHASACIKVPFDQVEPFQLEL